VTHGSKCSLRPRDHRADAERLRRMPLPHLAEEVQPRPRTVRDHEHRDCGTPRSRGGTAPVWCGASAGLHRHAERGAAGFEAEAHSTNAADVPGIPPERAVGNGANPESAQPRHDRGDQRTDRQLTLTNWPLSHHAIGAWFVLTASFLSRGAFFSLK
jgi:hypothetical protein